MRRLPFAGPVVLPDQVNISGKTRESCRRRVLIRIRMVQTRCKSAVGPDADTHYNALLFLMVMGGISLSVITAECHRWHDRRSVHLTRWCSRR